MGEDDFIVTRKNQLSEPAIYGIQWDDANIGNYSIAFGENTIAKGDRSSAFGENTTAFGTNSVALGRETNADASASLVIGRFNVGGGTSDNWISADPVFEIGNGTSDARTNNAVTVLKNGNVGIGGSNPVSKLSVGTDGNISATLSSLSSASSGFGIYGLASGSGGRGVFGIATDGGSTINYGGYFSSNGTSGVVYMDQHLEQKALGYTGLHRHTGYGVLRLQALGLVGVDFLLQHLQLVSGSLGREIIVRYKLWRSFSS